jgi:hypothetical protein
MGMKRISTLITPATTYDLVTLEAVKIELELKDADTSKDAWLAGVISEVSGTIQRYCNRSPRDVNEGSFPVEKVQDLFFPERDPYPYQVPGGADPLQLSRWPISTPEEQQSGVVSVVITDPPGTNTTLVEGSDFIVNSAFGQLIKLDPFTAYPTLWMPVTTTVIYTGGYASIPDDIAMAAKRWVSQRWADRGRNPNLRAKEQPNIGREEYWVGGPPMSGGVPQEIAEVLDSYRTPTTA